MDVLELIAMFFLLLLYTVIAAGPIVLAYYLGYRKTGVKRGLVVAGITAFIWIGLLTLFISFVRSLYTLL